MQKLYFTREVAEAVSHWDALGKHSKEVWCLSMVVFVSNRHHFKEETKPTYSQ